MGDLFLSASIPVEGRPPFYKDADPFLIQFAVRELLTIAVGRRKVIWGGHPAITPMVWSVCEDLGVDYAASVMLYQSAIFEDFFPEENERFKNVCIVEAVNNSREESLERMRRQMLTSHRFETGVFIGGMEGVIDECRLFQEYHPEAKIVAVGAPGGAAKILAKQFNQALERIDFFRQFSEELGIAPEEERAMAKSLAVDTQKTDPPQRPHRRNPKS